MATRIDKATDAINDTSKKIVREAKNIAFDIVAAVVIVAMLIISLGAIKMKDVTWQTIKDIIISVIPFYLANTVLSLNYYQKGVYSAKSSEAFKSVVKAYSIIVNALDGLHHKMLKTFCLEYNAEALKNIQKTILERHSLTYEEFMYGNDDHPPFVRMENKNIRKLYGKEIAKCIKHVKNASVKGINVNILLSSYVKSDVTDLGPNEIQLTRKRTFWYAFGGVFGIVAMTLIGAKDIWEWGWMGAAIALFKLAWIVARAYMRYYEGYGDISNKFANHISRKSDILKEFNAWYDERKKLNNEDAQLKIGI